MVSRVSGKDGEGGKGIKVKLISTKRNPLLARREIDFEIQQPSTPSRLDTRNLIAEQLKVDPERVYILRLETQTGTQTTIGRSHVYDADERAQLIEESHIIARNNPSRKEEKEDREE